tara:strand:+ start:7377 stop:7883 length:507 start_codon:yes stop_codon:yes gene_type:complete
VSREQFKIRNINITKIKNTMENKIKLEDLKKEIIKLGSKLNRLNEEVDECKIKLISFKKYTGLDMPYFDMLIANIFKNYQITLDTLKEKNRERPMVQIRQVLTFLLTKNTPFTLKDIGVILGGRNHATIIHSRKVIKDFIDIGDESTLETIRLMDESYYDFIMESKDK